MLTISLAAVLHSASLAQPAGGSTRATRVTMSKSELWGEGHECLALLLVGFSQR